MTAVGAHYPLAERDIPPVLAYDDIACRTAPTGTFDGERHASTQLAKALCRQCPHQAECLEWALKTGQPSAIWGGATEKERRAILRKRSGKAA
jgi:WhiB family redox-sensing transcriptional regulator